MKIPTGFIEESTLKVLRDTPQIAELRVVQQATPSEIRDLDLIMAIAFRVGHMAGVNEAITLTRKFIHSTDPNEDWE